MAIDLEIPPSQSDPHLPMIVNLRGDEDFAEDFHIDAEQAMEMLAIKRSRLTQISGRELRVGRIRRDRYIRPVYRESDLRDYQEWTRATATHQSSSRAIEQAIDSLDDRFNDLFVVLHERLQQFQNHENEFLKKKFAKVQIDLGLQLNSLQADLERILHELFYQERRQQLLRREQQQLKDLQHEQLGISEETRQRLINFHQDLRELVASFALQRRDQQKLTAGLKEFAETLPQLLADQQSFWQSALQQLHSKLELTITSHLQVLDSSLIQLAGTINEPSPRAKSILRQQPRRSPQGRRPYLER